MAGVSQLVFNLAIEIVVFAVLTDVGILIYNRIKNNSNRFLNPKEFLSEDELYNLKQLFYLFMMASSFIIVLYSLIYIRSDLVYLAVFDILISVVIAVTLDKTSLKNKLLILFKLYSVQLFHNGYHPHSGLFIFH